MQDIFKTHELMLAAYLDASGCRLQGLEEDAPGHFLFMFHGKAVAEELVAAYWAREAMVSVRRFVESFESLKQLLFSQKRNMHDGKRHSGTGRAD